MTRELLNRKNLNFHAWNFCSQFQNFLFIEKKLKRDLFKRNVSCILFEEDDHHVALLCLYNPFSLFLWYKKSCLKGIRTVYANRVFFRWTLKIKLLKTLHNYMKRMYCVQVIYFLRFRFCVYTEFLTLMHINLINWYIYAMAWNIHESSL